jgi:hypothetical protein
MLMSTAQFYQVVEAGVLDFLMTQKISDLMNAGIDPAKRIEGTIHLPKRKNLGDAHHAK